MIIAEQTLGNIKYQLIDDAYPQHSETGGTIAITPDSTIYQCNNGTDWIKFSPQCNGSMYFTGTTSPTYSPTINTWIYMSDRAWVPDYLAGFSVSASTYLVLDKDIIGKFLLNNTTSFGGTINSTRYCSTDIGNVVSGDTRPKCFNTDGHDNIAVTTTGTYSNIASHSIRQLKKGDKIIPAFAFNYKSNAASLIHFRYGYTSASLLEKATTLINEDFENYDFANWTVVQSATVNQWYVGSATTHDGTKSAYISNDGGNTVAYTNTAPSVSHFYRDFTVPSGITETYLSFYWKCTGEDGAAETSYDYGTVVLTATTFTPVSDVELSTTVRIGGRTLGKYNLTANWTYSNILLSVTPGGTYRLIFSFKCDNSVGVDPPFCVDDIKIYFF